MCAVVCDQNPYLQSCNSGGSEIFRTHPERPRGPPNILYGVSFPEGKAPGRGADHQLPSTAGVEF